MNFLLRLFCFLSLIFSDECKHIGQCDLYGVYIIRAAFAVVAKGSISVMPGVTFCSAISLLRRGAVVLALGFRFATHTHAPSRPCADRIVYHSHLNAYCKHLMRDLRAWSVCKVDLQHKLNAKHSKNSKKNIFLNIQLNLKENYSENMLSCKKIGKSSESSRTSPKNKFKFIFPHLSLGRFFFSWVAYRRRPSLACNPVGQTKLPQRASECSPGGGGSDRDAE